MHFHGKILSLKTLVQQPEQRDGTRQASFVYILKCKLGKSNFSVDQREHGSCAVEQLSPKPKATSPYKSGSVLRGGASGDAPAEIPEHPVLLPAAESDPHTALFRC